MSILEDNLALGFLTETVRPLKKRKIGCMNLTEKNDGKYFRTYLPLYDYPDEFHRYYRMNVDTFNYIPINT